MLIEYFKIDVFEIESEDDLGILYAIEIILKDCLSRANDLDLEKVEIVYNNHSFNFDYNDETISVKNPEKIKCVKKILFENNAQFF